MPLSGAQERMWFFHQLDPGASAYNVCILWRLTGDLDREALRAAFARMVARHEVLRTVYRLDAAGVPSQQVLDHLPPEWVDHDLTGLVGEAQEAALQVLARQAGRAPFDLAERSPLRLELVRFADHRHALVMVGQHICWDGPAFGVFAHELGVAYADLLAGRGDSLPPLAVQYGDFAAWHRQRWRRGDGPGGVASSGSAADQASDQLVYWRRQLTPLPVPLTIPTDAARPAALDEEGGWCTRQVGVPLTRALVDLAAAEHATPFMALATGVSALLGRYCGADEVTLGTVVHNRHHADLAPLIGNLGNTVALRVGLGGRPTFRTLLRRVREVCTGAYAHADVPFDRVLDELGVPRRLDRSPLFDVTVIFLAQDMASPDLPGLNVSWEKFHNGTTQTDLSIDALLLDGELGLQSTYRTSLFRHDTVVRLLARLEAVLTQVAADPDRPVDDLDLLLDGERSLIRGRWAARPAATVDRDGAGSAPTVSALFEAQVARSPERDAVDDGRQRLTFTELNARANRLARLLAAEGAGPEARVALALPRTADALVAILAALKCGAAYVPLDPTYPPDHLSRVLTAAEPVVVVTAAEADGPGFGRAPAGTTVVALGEPAVERRLASLPATDLTDADRTAALWPDHPAMVVFTSGSTGRPKGVVVLHSGLVNLFHSHRAELHELARSRTSRDDLQVAHAWSFSFDAAWQPQLWLLDGHTLHVLPYEVYADPQALAAELVARRVDFVELTPTLLEATLDELAPEQVPAVVGFGGEAASPTLWSRLADLPGTAAFNLYGPTEATVDSLVARVAPGTGPAVGHPVAGARVAVLDASLRPVPPSVPGELYIAGPGLARGYLGRPDLTAERFVADPYGPPGARSYRTGDLVRWRADGELEFLGRADDQLKVRGFRVEPAEVEAALRRVSGGRPAAVVAREDRPGVRLLVAYVVGDTVVDSAELRRRLAGELPEHMVPSAIVVLDRLPLMPNGKVDRAALPAPPATGGGGEPPRTAAERSLARLVGEVLGVADVAADDGFFELGGDSILAIQLVSRARRAGWTFRPRDVFTHRTVRELAGVAQPIDAVEDDEAADDDSGDVLLPPLAQDLVERLGPVARFAQSVLVTLPDEVDADHLAAGLQAVVDHHEALRSRLVCQPDGWVLRPLPPGEVAVRLRHVEGDPSDALIAAEAALATEGLDLAQGTMLQAVLLGDHRVLLVAHHLAVDGVSWRIVVDDLAAACAARAAGRDPQLDKVDTSLRRWTRRLAGLADERGDEVDHWCATLDRPDPLFGARALDPGRDTLATAGSLTRRLGPDVVADVLTRVPTAFYAEVDDVLLAALALAVAAWREGRGTRHRTLLVDVEGHGRDHDFGNVDLTRTIGWLTSLHPLALDPGVDPGDSSWDEAWAGRRALGQVLRRVKEQRRAVPGDGLAFGALRHMRSDTAATLAALPSPQVGFNYLGRFGPGNGTVPWSAVPRLAATETFNPTVPLTHAVEITAVAVETDDGPELVATWTWAGDLLDAEDVDDLAGLWSRALDALAMHARAPNAGGRTPSDLPLVQLTQDRLDRLEAELPPFDDLWPLTPLQELMLDHADGAPADPWTSHVAFTIDAPAEPEAWHRAAGDLLDRFPNLRAGFCRDEAMAFVPAGVAVPGTELDLSEREPAAAAAEMARLEAVDHVAGFDPEAPPLLRLTTAQMPDGRTRVLLASHHLLLDGWSVPLALADLLALHGASTPPPARPPYRDFLAWLAAQDHGVAVDAWTEALAGLDGPTLVAPPRTVRPTVDRQLVLPEPVTERLTARSAELGLTLNAVVQAAWATTVARLTGRSDVAFGAFVAGRPPDLPGVEAMVGLLLGVVPVRARLRPGLTAEALARALQDQQADLSELPHVRLPEVARRLELPTLFDTLVVFESFPGDALGLGAAVGGTALQDVAWRDSVGFPLALFCYPGPALRLRLCHDPQAVDGATAAATLREMAGRLEAIAWNPATPLDDIAGARGTIT